LFEDHGSTRIDLACPHCQQLFKVRLRKLQFGADLTCRLCRHEFSARDVSDRPEVQEAVTRMIQIVKERVRYMEPRRNRNVTEERDDEEQDHHSARMSRPAERGRGAAEGSLCRMGSTVVRESLTFNQRVLGSSPSALTKPYQALEASIDDAGRSHPALIPHPHGPALLAKARLVLAPELGIGLGMLSRDGAQPCWQLLF
jgi:hypothetical protein